ncbi:MAG: carbon-nitrogen hydrolase family protein [Fimbriimonadaceae bacterium]
MRLACFQWDVVFGDPGANADRIIEGLDVAVSRGVDLAVFPEAFLTGYCVGSREDAERIAVRVSCDKDFEVTDACDEVLRVQAAAIERGLHVVFGYAGVDDFGPYNGAMLVEPNGRMRRYVKTHLPCLGFDQFATAGTALPVFDTDLGRIGILICYDLRPPEATRVMALRGAELVVLPTNWPTRKGTTPALMCPARAMENKIFFASCNRVGDENGFSFRGESAIYGVGGEVLDSIGEGEGVIVADMDLSLAREKRSVIIPGVFETDAFGCRQPGLYRDLAE